MNVFDTEIFIIEVEKEECLWKTNSKEYMDRNVKLKAWVNIGSTVYDCWETFGKDEQDFKIEELKKKWKHLRDNYAREINETRKVSSGSEAKNSKKYAYSDLLSFLQPVLKKRKTTGNMQYQVPLTEFCNTVLNENTVNEDLHDDDSFISVGNTSAHQHDEPKQKQERLSNFQSSLLHFMKNPPLAPKPEEFDADKAFLLSFLPDLKKMNEIQKFDLKIQMLQPVKNILNPPQISLASNNQLSLNSNLHQFNYHPNYNSSNQVNLSNPSSQNVLYPESPHIYNVQPAYHSINIEPNNYFEPLRNSNVNNTGK